MDIEVVPVGHGDCLLISGSSEAPFPFMMIDGGPASHWRDQVRPAVERHAGRNGIVVIDVVAITHVDDDHIGGVLELLRQMKRDRDDGVTRFKITDLWHNAPGRRAVHPTHPAGAFDEPHDVQATANSLEVSWLGGEAVSAEASSFAQSDAITTLATELEIGINVAFGGGIITEGLVPNKDELRSTVRILGPDAKAFANLDRAYGRPRDQHDGAVALTVSDRSVPNLSSIVLLIHDGRRSILLAADARGDHVVRAIERARADGKGRPYSVDVLKVPHHGSSRSVDEAFFRSVTAEVYVFCGDGRHGNPERATVARLLSAQDGKAYRIVFTSAPRLIDAAIRADRERERERCRLRGLPELAQWLPEIDGLEDLLGKRPVIVEVAFPDEGTIRL